MSRTIAYIKADELIKTLGQKAEANAERGYMTAFDVIHECIEIVKAQPKLLGIVGCSTIEAYNKGLEDAWELARKIVLDVSKGGIPERNMRSMFGEKWTVSDILKNYTPQEALAKLEAYEKEQNKIKAGYVYEIMGKFCAVVQVDEFNNEYHIIWCDGCTDRIPFETPIGFKKTGKHIDIQSILQQIGGGSDE